MKQKPGKISSGLFAEFIRNKYGFHRSEVIAGPQFGVDVSVVDLQHGMAMASTSDPLSLIPSLGLQESAWLSVHLMANDMATTGFAPMYGQFVLNLPAALSKTDFKRYWHYIHRFCTDIKVAITGGHTGFIEGQESTIAGGGTFTAIAPRNEMLLSTNARAGDTILVTKCCGLSAAAILAMSFPQTVINRAGVDLHRQACASFYQTSSLQDALIAVDGDPQRTGVTAMHDVTEGGVLGAVYEMAIASGNGVLIYEDRLPVKPVQAAVCSIFDIDPKHCIGAGSMIIACSKEATEGIISRLQVHHIDCVAVGEFRDQQEGLHMVQQDKKLPLSYSGEDPYWGAFFHALKRGWK